MKRLVIGTHNGVFHPDEIIAIAMILADTDDVSIIRSRDPKELEKADILVDVGGMYDGVKFFDHHQLTEESELYGLSSAGMVAKSIRYHLSSENRLLIEAVDKRDTRVNWSKNGKFETFFNSISDCNELDIYSKKQEITFERLVNLFKRYFSIEFSLGYLQLSIVEIGNENKKIKSIIMADRFSNVEKIGMVKNIPIYRNKELEYVDTRLFENKPYIFISYDEYQGNYSISTNTNYCRIVNVSNAIFIHANGFFAKTKSIDDLVIDIEENK